jgi:hypothetical protein
MIDCRRKETQLINASCGIRARSLTIALTNAPYYKGINMSNQRSVNDLCKEREMSSDELAAQSGLDPQRCLAIVLGQWTPSPNERDRVAAVFELTKDQIVWGHKTPIQHIHGL